MEKKFKGGMVTKTGIWITILAMVIASLLLLIPSQPAIIVMAQPEIPEGWVEIISERTRVGKKYANLTNPSHESITTGLATIHYESIMGTGVYDSECDFSPQRINNAQLDGWRVTQCGWHYALGQPSGKTTDGWVGFGGRQGSNWIMFRLSRVGYLHWPTRNWEDLGGLPTYNRLDLVSEVGQSEYGYRNMVNVSATTTWSNIWTTPDNGALNITWQASGDRLKEEIIINQAAREWLQTNRPPSTPASETWFGFVLRVDWTDIPKVIKDGLEQNINDDWDVTDTPIELRDNLDRLLAFMPISEVIVRDGINETREPLTKQFWLEDGNHYVLMGIRVPELVNMPEGDLIFDPSITEEVVSSADDGRGHPTFSSVLDRLDIGEWDGSRYDTFVRWRTIGIEQGTVINIANVTYTGDNPCTPFCGDVDLKTDIWFNDIDDAIAPTTQGEYESLDKTTATVIWDDFTFIADQEITTPDITTIIQEIIDRAGWNTNNDMMIIHEDDPPNDQLMAQFWSYDGSSAKAPKLNIDYVAWENSAPTITNPLIGVTVFISTIYSRLYTGTDADSNQTLTWALNSTDAPFTITVDSLNRSAYLNFTTDTIEAEYYINITLTDGIATVYNNFTLTVQSEALSDFEWVEVILIAVMFMFFTGLGFAKAESPLLIIAGFIGIAYALWLIAFLVFPLIGLVFIFPGLVVLAYGLVNIREVRE